MPAYPTPASVQARRPKQCLWRYDPLRTPNSVDGVQIERRTIKSFWMKKINFLKKAIKKMTDNVHGLWIPELIYIIYIIYRFYKSLFAYFINFFLHQVPILNDKRLNCSHEYLKNRLLCVKKRRENKIFFVSNTRNYIGHRLWCK